MSERFEQEIKRWYSDPEVVKLEYLNLEFPKPILRKSNSSQFYCFHKDPVHHSSKSDKPFDNFLVDSLETIKYSYLFSNQQRILSSNVFLKNFKRIQEDQQKYFDLISSRVSKLERKIDSTTKSLSQIQSELDNHKPLTVKQVTELVEQIAKQPKLVEAEVLKLTKNLEEQVTEVKKLVHEVRHLLTS